jgi:hypothetical protein
VCKGDAAGSRPHDVVSLCPSVDVGPSSTPLLNLQRHFDNSMQTCRSYGLAHCDCVKSCRIEASPRQKGTVAKIIGLTRTQTSKRALGCHIRLQS